jgi:membrane protein YdbS with pleckstrin-like domain
MNYFIPLPLSVLRRIANVVSFTAFMIGVVGATIYAAVQHPYIQAVGFGAYVLLAVVEMTLYLVRQINWQTTIEDVHTLIADTNAAIHDLQDYVTRNDL